MIKQNFFIKKRRHKTKNIIFYFLFFVLTFFFVYADYNICKAKTGSDYPKLANHYLKWGINKKEAEDLAKWDLLVLDFENESIGVDSLKILRELNPDIILLSYINPQEIVNNIDYPQYSTLRYGLLKKINDSDWWLRDVNGNKTSFWPGSSIIDVTNISNSDWSSYLPIFVKNNILSNGHWDGVFYDETISNFPAINAQTDLDKDGHIDTSLFLDNKWREGLIKILQTTREENKNIIIIGNSADYNGYQTFLNGRTFESFPTPWEGDGTWTATMRPYLIDLPAVNIKPQIYTINSNTSNSGNYADYQKMRFGLASTLLGDGYFSFDHGDEDHAQLWWYDEYDVELGPSESSAYNALDKKNYTIKPSVWRRDFENGISLVNSTDQEKTYIFSKEEFEKINGTQDRRVNNGAIINFVKIPAKDGIILIKRKKEIRDSSFDNGSFVRVFDDQGDQVQNGFFSYIDQYPGNTQVLVTDLDGNSGDEVLVNGGGVIKIYKEGKMINSFEPYNMVFRGEVSMAVSDLNGDGTKEIITGAGAGGGPHVRVFSKDGKPITAGFFAYTRSFRGGVNIAVMDLNGDGTKEIITGAGAGGGPQVRVFSKDGNPLTAGFFAYDKDFKGGVSIAVGNVDGKGDKEIITGTGSGDKPLVRVFSKDGELKKEFMGYGEDITSGIKVMSYDINNDNIDEILVSTISF